MEFNDKGEIKVIADLKAQQAKADLAKFKNACVNACITSMPATATISGANAEMLQGQLRVFAVLPVNAVISRVALGVLANMPMVKGGWTKTPNNRAGNAVSVALRRCGLYKETHNGKGEQKEYYYTLLRAVLPADLVVTLK